MKISCKLFLWKGCITLAWSSVHLHSGHHCFLPSCLCSIIYGIRTSRCQSRYLIISESIRTNISIQHLHFSKSNLDEIMPQKLVLKYLEKTISGFNKHKCLIPINLVTICLSLPFLSLVFIKEMHVCYGKLKKGEIKEKLP